MSNGPTAMDWAEIAFDRKLEIDRLRGLLQEAQRWVPAFAGDLYTRIDAALAGTEKGNG